MSSRALREVESDLHKTLVKLSGAFDAPDPDSETWMTVIRLAERMQEEAQRAWNLARQAETLAKLQQMTPGGLPE